MSAPGQRRGEGGIRALQVLDTIRDPVILLDADNHIGFANLEAEYFFLSSSAHLEGRRIDDFLPFSSPLLALIGQVRQHHFATKPDRVGRPGSWLGPCGERAA